MRLILLIAALVALSSAAFAADPVYPSKSATWSNREGAGGGTQSVARYRMGFDGDVIVPADYRICNLSQSATVTFDVGEPATSSIDIPVEAPNNCKCIGGATALNFRSSNDTNAIVSGTYEAFPQGSKCKGKPLAVSSATPRQMTCTKVFDETSQSPLCRTVKTKDDPPGEINTCFPGWFAEKCTIDLPKKRANYRVCTSHDSIIGEGGAVYELSNAKLVTNLKLANYFSWGTTGQPIPQFVPLTGDCVDLFQVNEIGVLIGPYPNDKPNHDLKIEKMTISVQTIGR